MPSLKSLTTSDRRPPAFTSVNIVAALVIGSDGTEVGEGAGEGT